MKAAMKSALIGIAIVCSVGLNASATILPPNNLAKFDTHRVANIDEQLFNKIIDTIIAAWQPIAAAHGAQLSAEKRWDDSTVNASASQSGNKWQVHMYGGLARRPEVTPDAFAMVVCHELGHHFGGYYYYGDGDDWAAAEGESDYWATQVCGRRIFSQALMRNHRYREGVPQIVKEKCDASWKDPKQQDECYRLAAAGYSLAELLAVVGGGKAPHFETPDPRKVSHTNVDHPEAQCRLDTYFQGALCKSSFDLRVIPGKKGDTGENTKEAEQEAGKYSCFGYKGDAQGERPACWFKAQLGSY